MNTLKTIIFQLKRSLSYFIPSLFIYLYTYLYPSSQHLIYNSFTKREISNLFRKHLILSFLINIFFISYLYILKQPNLFFFNQASNCLSIFLIFPLNCRVNFTIIAKHLNINIFKSTMKTMLNMKQIEHIAEHAQKIITSNFEQPHTSKLDIIDKIVTYATNNSLGENITLQTFAKGLYPRVSYSKGNIQAALKNANHNSSKVIIEDPKEFTDLRWIFEKIAANRFAATSNLIQEIRMNSEKPNTSSMTAITSKIQTGQTTADTTIKFNIDGVIQETLKDIKCGNNAKYPFSAVLAEITHDANNQPYCIINDPLNLSDIQNKRASTIADISCDIVLEFFYFFTIFFYS